MVHRQPITKETSKTTSERYLQVLAEKSFLKIWAYPSPYNDKKQNGSGDGKELCDLIIVFGNQIILFSDKDIGWSSHNDVRVCWKRWYRDAIKKSVKQLLGAKRWITKFPERVYLDKRCTQKFPVRSIDGGDLCFHLVAVANGSESANQRFFRGGDGALIQDSNIRGADHDAKDGELFRVGDVSPSSCFVHVLDRVSLTVAMHEFNTISDFTEYLSKRAIAFRGQTKFSATGEPDLIGYFLQNRDQEGRPQFELADDRDADEILIPEGFYSNFIKSEPYRRKQSADEDSYFWDRLIDIFGQDLLDGEIINSAEQEDYFSYTEKPLRVMAAEDRVSRRGLGKAFSEFMLESVHRAEDQLFRTVLSNDMRDGRDIIYVLLILVFGQGKFENKYDLLPGLSAFRS